MLKFILNKMFKSRFGRILKTHVWIFYEQNRKKSWKQSLYVQQRKKKSRALASLWQEVKNVNKRYFTAQWHIIHLCIYFDDKFSVVTRIFKSIYHDTICIFELSNYLQKRTYCYYGYYITIKHWMRSTRDALATLKWI